MILIQHTNQQEATMAITLKKQTLDPEDIADVLSSLRYTPPSSRGDSGTISVLGSPPVFMSTLSIMGHHQKDILSIRVTGYSSFLIMSRFFGEAVTFKNWYPKEKPASKRQRHWELQVGVVTISCIRRWGEGMG